MPKRKNTELRVSVLQICDGWNLARPTVAQRLEGVPYKKAGNSKLYELRDVVKAMSNPDRADPTDLSAAERDRVAQADLKEEKLKRMRGESVDAQQAAVVFADCFKRLADSVKGITKIPLKDRRSICAQLQAEVKRIGSELRKCAFKEAKGEDA